MENKKSGVLIGVIIGLLIGIIIGLCLFIAMDKKDNDKKDNDTKQTEEKVNNDDNKTIEGEEYTALIRRKCSKRNASTGELIEEYGVTSGKVDVDTSKYSNIFAYIVDQDNIRIVVNYYEDDGTGNYVEKQKNLTDSEVKTFINNMKKSTFSVKEGGLGGALIPYILIYYTRNGQEHTINIWDNISLICATDINIFKIIDDNLVEIDDNHVNYIINNFDNTIYDFIDRFN